MLDRPRVGSGKKDGWLAQGGEFAVETRGQGTVDMCGVDERLAGSGFSGREEPWQEKGLKDEEKKGQSLEEDEGAWCQWAVTVLEFKLSTSSRWGCVDVE